MVIKELTSSIWCGGFYICKITGNVNQTLISRYFREGGFPDGSDGKESACSAGDLGLVPESGIAPREGNGTPSQYACLDNSMARGAWWAMSMGS